MYGYQILVFATLLCTLAIVSSYKVPKRRHPSANPQVKQIHFITTSSYQKEYVGRTKGEHLVESFVG